MSGYGVSIKNISVNTLEKKVQLLQTHTVLYSLYMCMGLNIFFFTKTQYQRKLRNETLNAVCGFVHGEHCPESSRWFVLRFEEKTNKRLNKLTPQNEKVEKN